MKTIKKLISTNSFHTIKDSIVSENYLFFDIETTGLSSKKHQIYCIGSACYFKKKMAVEIQQLLGESLSDERELIEIFIDLIRSDTILVSYNGSTFDIRFILERAKFYNLSVESLKKCQHIDLYKTARHLNPIFQLDSLKQISLERFFNIYREDRLSGKELISIYFTYIKTKKETYESCLLLHNFEDISGLLSLYAIIHYDSLLRITDDPFLYQIVDNAYLEIQITHDIILPKPISREYSYGTISFDNSSLTIIVPIYFGKINHYFPDIKNYYYLPEEDMVIHKSIGTYVESSKRQPASRENCFVSKESYYLKLPVKRKHPIFQLSYIDKQGIYEIDSEDIQQFRTDFIHCLFSFK